jgi:hypothetical protein
MNTQDIIRDIPQQPQTQESLSDQLLVLQAAANKLGLYDAAEFLREVIERKESKA